MCTKDAKHVSPILSSIQKNDLFSATDIWITTCGKCHNLRSPRDYNPEKWDILLMHMRTTSDLTGEEQRALLEYFKSFHTDKK
jgi:hypothetical protein